MRAMRAAAAAIGVCAVLAVLAMPAAAAVKLPVRLAAEKAFIFAKHTCAHDRNCVRYGVENCRRQSLHVVLCRIMDQRDTAAQGRYKCTRLVRVALNPRDYRVQVTGRSRWQCS